MALEAKMAKLIVNPGQRARGNLAGPTPTAFFRDSGYSLQTAKGRKSEENLKRNEAAEDTWKE